MILKAVYNLKLPREYTIHFSPLKKKFQLEFNLLSAASKHTLSELLNYQSPISSYCASLSDFRLIDENRRENSPLRSLLLSSVYADQEDSRWKFNYEKMEIALLFYQELINSPALTPEKGNLEDLSVLYRKISSTKRAEIERLGRDILVNFLEYEPNNISGEFSYSVGKTKYFFSYNQNLLEHLLEVSVLSANFASQLKLDVQKAKRAAFFHDIGKIVGQHSNHVSAGVSLAHQFRLEPYIVETIQFHHNYEIRWETPYLPIVRTMDKLSAGRLGARPLQLEKTRERNEKLQSILVEIEEISKVEFLAGGHIIRLHLNPTLFSWDKLEEMKIKISQLVSEAELKYQYNYQFVFKLEFEASFMLEDYSKTV
ncbi:HDIG domain-containing metalloprotein [Candidatus Mycoplasma haematominutum]|uniref:HDIG domain-containing metalloprotein n=1 Tax=Candidatus Mycoplasma haematominutum TaxID=209446 RepID=UPI0002FCDAF4|nr:HDIG domain-containing metalloprotein [Candidatus Mycoplasma haematominutum]